MIIYDVKSNQVHNTPINVGGVYSNSLMGDEYVRILFDSNDLISFVEGNYITYDNEKYALIEPYIPERINEDQYHYELTFWSPRMMWKKMLLFYMFDSRTGRESNFTTTDNIANLGIIIANNLAVATGVEYEIKYDPSLTEVKNFNFESSSIFDALTTIANEFNTEWWISGKEIHFSRAEHGERKTLIVGESINVPTVTKPSDSYFTRYYVYGSTRNLEQDYDTGQATNHQVTKRLVLPLLSHPKGYIDIRPDLKEGEIFTSTLIFDDIYPRSFLKISDVRVLERHVAIEGSTEEEYQVRWVFKLADFDFDISMVLDGSETPSARFTSGSLNGFEFVLNYYDKDQMPDPSNPSWAYKAGDFEIVADSSTGITIPSRGSLEPMDGDSLSLFNIVMPDEYVDAAEAELLEAANEEIERLLSNRNEYQFSSNSAHFKNTGIDLNVGSSVLYKDGDKELSTRVLTIEKKLDYPIEQNITIGEERRVTRNEELREEVAQVTQSVGALVDFSAIASSITNGYGRAMQEITAGLVRMGNLWSFTDNNESITSPFKVKTPNGLQVGKDLIVNSADYGVSDFSVAEFLSLIKYERDSSNRITGVGFKANVWANGGITALGQGDSGSGSSSTMSFGNLVNVGSWADETPTVDRIIYQARGATHWASKPLSEIVGLDTTALSAYLTTNGYATQSWVTQQNFIKGVAWGDITNKPDTFYTLPTASGTVLGGIKVGAGLAIAAGLLSVNLAASNIPDLPASKITTGIFETSRIPDLDASKTISGVFDVARIPDLSASKITSGTFDVARIPALSADKITSGILGVDRIPTLGISKISGLQTALDNKLNASIFDELFTPVYESGVLKHIRANFNFYSVGGITALGQGTVGEGGGGGLIQTVYGYGDLGGTFSNTNLTSTFNPYTTNQLYLRIKSLEDNVPLTFNVSGTGNVVTGVTKAANSNIVTVTKGVSIYDWAQASAKPAYAFSEITGTLATSQIPSLSGSYVDLTSAQTVGGNKTFTGSTYFNNGIHIYFKKSGGMWNSTIHVSEADNFWINYGESFTVKLRSVTGTPLYHYTNNADYPILSTYNYSSYALPLSGGTLTGDLITRNVYPSANNTYTSGLTGNRWANVFTTLLNVSGDSTLTGLVTTGTGFAMGTSRFGTTGAYATIKSGGNEMVISGGTDMYINYRADSVYAGVTPTRFIWNAGSATTYAAHGMGNLTVNGTLSVTGAATLSSTLSVVGTLTASGIANADRLGITNVSGSTGYGLSLYNGALSGQPTYGIMFAGTPTFGTHGSVTGDWATYFTMNDTTNRGWIFRRGSTNVASISSGGVVTAASLVSLGGLTAAGAASIAGALKVSSGLEVTGDTVLNNTLKVTQAITATGGVVGNSSTATTLLNSRLINGSSFNGSADIVTSYWGTARNIYISDSTGANTGAAVSVNGNANATLKLPATIVAALTGNASTASALYTTRYLWGQAFTGAANVTGSLSSVIDITMTGNLSTTGSYLQVGSARIMWDSTNNALYLIKSDGTAINFYTYGGITALGQSGSVAGGSGSGLIQSVYAYGDLGKTFSNTTLTDTFNAYAINSVHLRVKSLEDNPYTLPIATASVLGGIKVGTGLSIASGVLSVNFSAYTLPAATTTTLGGVIVGTGLSISSGTLSTNLAAAQIPNLDTSKITSGVFAVARIPIATTAAVGGVSVSTGLSVTAAGALSLATVVTAGTYPKITFDAYGRVTGGSAMVAGDIPSLPASIITSGALGVTVGGTGKTTVAINSMLYASAANTYAEVTTNAFGRSLLNATSGTMFSGLYANYATSSYYPLGFSSRSAASSWGNQTGGVITDWGDGYGGNIAFRYNNPASGALSVLVDGYFYQNEGRYFCLDTNNYSSYALPLSGGTMTGNIAFGASASLGKTLNLCAQYSHLSQYSFGSASLTGTIKITLPVGWSSSMNVYEIIIYDYSSLGASKLIIGGYNYTTGWVNYNVSIQGSYNKGVRLAYDGTNACILLGTTTTSWSYPKVYLSRVTSGHSNYASFSTGYSITGGITDESSITNVVSPSHSNGFFSNITMGGALTGATTGAFSSNVTIGGTLAVTGTTTLTGVLSANSGIVLPNNVSLNGKGTSGTAYDWLFADTSNRIHVGNINFNLSLRSTSADILHNRYNANYPILDTYNYNSYVPTLTGTGASGTWGISVNGNAATVTNGMYLNVEQTSVKKKFYKETADSSDYAAGIELRERGLLATSVSSIYDAPGISFHWGSRYVKALRMNTSGNLIWGNGEGSIIYHAGNSNLTSVSWSALNLTAAGTLSVSGYGYFYQPLVVNTSGTGNYNQGIRINNGGGWATLTLGGSSGSTSGSDANTWLVGSPQGYFVIDRSNSTGGNGFSINSSGNMGIGYAYSSIPGYKLGVNGTFYSAGEATFGSTVNANGSQSFTTNHNAAISATNFLCFGNNVGGIIGICGDNDFWRIYGRSTATNAGYLELATADDGTEPIYVRQYTGVFSTLTRTLTLLDGSGNTSIPGTLNISGSLFYINSKLAINGGDSWLRINEGLTFSSGIYTGSSLIRSDYRLEVGSSGSAFYANSAGVVWASAGFGTNGADMRTPTGNDYNTGAFEIRGIYASGIHPRIGFHSPGYYASSISATSGSNFSFWTQGGTGYANITVNSVTAGGYIQSNTRIFTGYDSGVANSVSCSGWFRSNGATGWINASYAAGIYSEESGVVRTYSTNRLKVLSTADSTTAASNALYVAGTICSGTNIWAQGGITALGSSTSDERLKENIRDFDALSIINKLPIFSFDWNDKALKWNRHLTNDYTHFGTSAQEVQKVLPGFVKEYDGYLTVSYEKFIPVLMGAVQCNAMSINTLLKRADKVETRVEKLERENKELKAKIKALEEARL